MPIRNPPSIKSGAKVMFEAVNPHGRIERHIGQPEMALGIPSHRILLDKRREHELENRILYLEDQLIQMNFNLSLVSNVVDLLSTSSHKGDDSSPSPAKQPSAWRLRPDGLVMKGRPLPHSSELPGCHPYLAGKRGISKSQTELRSHPTSFLREKRTYSIENLLKPWQSDESCTSSGDCKDKKAPFSSKGLTGHGSVIKHGNTNIDASATASCRQCLFDLSKRDNNRIPGEHCLTLRPNNIMMPHLNRSDLINAHGFRSFPFQSMKTPFMYEGKEPFDSQPPLLCKENNVLESEKRLGRTECRSRDKCSKGIFAGMEMISSVASDISLGGEKYLHPRHTGEQSKACVAEEKNVIPFKVNHLKTESLENDPHDEEIIVDIEQDGCDSNSAKWSDSEEEDGSCESGLKEQSFESGQEDDKDDYGPEPSYTLPDHCSVMEVIKLWEEGTSSIPPIRKWSPIQRAKQKSKISRWRKIMHIFKEKYDKNLGEFLKAYSDNKGRVLPVSAILSIHKDDDSVTDKDYENFQIGHEKDLKSMSVSYPINPKYVLPRKINGRQVTPLDILKIWERGIGSIPPIKQWTPSQKLKQQSKVSRWKKIVDLFKKDCNGKLSEFYKKFSYEDGKLMPVSAVLARCESRRNTSISPKIE